MDQLQDMVFGNNHDPSFQRDMRAAYRAGLAAGRELLREQAAGVCQARAAVHAADLRRRQWGGIEFEAARLEAEACAEAILALPLTAGE